MKLLKKSIFFPVKSKSPQEYDHTKKPIEEIPPKGKYRKKEILIISVVYLLIIGVIISLLMYLVMIYQDKSNSDKALQVLIYFLSPLLGYILGTNKEHE